MGKNKGFTLIELLVYIGIFSVLTISLVMFNLSLLSTRVKNQVIMEVEQQGVYAVQLISQLIRNAEAVNFPTVGENDSQLSLDVLVAAEDPTIFNIVDNQIFIKRGLNEFQALTADNLVVSDLIFYNSSQADTSGNISFQFTLTYQNISNTKDYEYSRIFYGSASLR